MCHKWSRMGKEKKKREPAFIKWIPDLSLGWEKIRG